MNFDFEMYGAPLTSILNLANFSMASEFQHSYRFNFERFDDGQSAVTLFKTVFEFHQTMPSILENLISTAGFSGIFGLIIYFILKHWFLERLKHSIRHEYKIKLETHKVELNQLLAQNNFRYSQVFNKTENVIATVYKMLLELKDASEGVTGANMVINEDRFKVFLEKAQEFLKFYEPNKIYIPKKTAKKTKSLFHTLQDAVVKWHVAIQMSQSPAADIAQRKGYFEKYFATTKEIPDLLSQIEVDFQTILGFPMSDED
jgi:hypothetical protein